MNKFLALSTSAMLTYLGASAVNAAGSVSESASQHTAGVSHSQTAKPATQLGGHPKRCQSLSSKAVSVPFSRGKAGHVLVDGTFNSHTEQTIVDTGGIGVGGVLSERAYKAINSSTKNFDTEMVQGAHQSREMKLTHIERTELGSIVSEGLRYVVSPSSVISEEAEALIGSEFLCSFLVEFDFQANQLILHPKSNTIEQIIEKDKAGWGIAAYASDKVPGAVTFNLLVESKPMIAVLDTGAKHSVMNWSAAKLIGINKHSARIKPADNTANGIHGVGSDKSYSVALDDLSLAESNNIGQKEMQMRIADMSAFKPLIGDQPAVNLGVDFLNGRKLLIDYAKRKIAITNHQ